MSANERQVGGDHYKGRGFCPHCNKEIQHWDISWIFGFDTFQYIITKWVFRWRSKGGLEDLKKARHALDKYIEVVESMQSKGVIADSGESGLGYTNQDRR